MAIRQSRGDGSRRVAGEVHEVSQAPADQGIHLHSIYLGWTYGIAITGILDRQARQGWRDQEIVLVEDALNGIVYLCPYLLIVPEVHGRHLAARVQPFQILWREVLPVVLEQVNPLLLEALECCQVDRHDQPAPNVAQLKLVTPNANTHLLDAGSSPLKGSHRFSHDVRDPRVDGEDIKIWAVGDLPALDGAAGGCEKVHMVRQAEGVPRIIARQRGHAQGCVFDGSGQGPLKEKRGIVAKSVGPVDKR